MHRSIRCSVDFAGIAPRYLVVWPALVSAAALAVAVLPMGDTPAANTLSSPAVDPQGPEPSITAPGET